MRAKRLEAILGDQCAIREAEMVQRFQKLRDMNLLPLSRGRNAEDISRDAIVSGLLSIVAERPGYAGMTVKTLRGLRPVGGPANAFAKAATFGQALHNALDDDALLKTIIEIRITDSEVYTNSHGRGAIMYREGSNTRTTYYVGQTAVSLFQPGKEIDYDPRELISLMIRETVVFPRLLQRIMREVRREETHARAMMAPTES
jgi:hypothetical protein